jgi:hypothetical protein
VARALFAPARTAPAIVDRLHAEAAKAVQEPKLRELLLSGGYEPKADPPAEFARIFKADIRNTARSSKPPASSRNSRPRRSSAVVCTHRTFSHLDRSRSDRSILGAEVRCGDVRTLATPNTPRSAGPRSTTSSS